MTIKSLAAWARILLIMVSLVAIGIAVVWTVFPSAVSTLDSHIVQIYMQHYHQKLNKGLEPKGTDDLLAVQKLESLLAGLESIKKMDRLDAIKRSALRELVALYQGLNESVSALLWAEHWMEFDERDLYAKAAHAKVLSSIAGREDEGLKELERLYHLVPEVRWTGYDYAKVLYAREFVTDAEAVLEKTMNSHDLQKDWVVYWDSGKGFNAKEYLKVWPVLQLDGLFQFSLPLPAGVIAIRIDPPAYLPLIIASPRVFINTPVSKIEVNVFAKPISLHQVKYTPSVFDVPVSNDPYFYWNMPQKFQGEAYTLEFSANVMVALPEWFECESGSERLERYCHKARTLTLHKKQFEIYWRTETDDFSAKMRRVVSYSDAVMAEDEFSFLVSPLSPMTILRIDFPDFKGMRYTLNDIRIETEQGEHNLSLDAIAFVHSLKRLPGNSFVVTGPDPYFGTAMSETNLMVKNVYVRGRIQVQ